MNSSQREGLAKSKAFQIKLKAIRNRLEELDMAASPDGDLPPREQREYNELVKSYKGTAMAWIKSRKSYGLATDMITVDYDW